jgi:hypothetical protein
MTRGASPPQDDPLDPGAAILSAVDPLDRLRSAGRRVTDPLESVAERVAELAVGLIATALDVNALLGRVDVNGLLAGVDVNEFLARVDVQALVDRVDVNEVLRRVDVDSLLDRVDVNALAGRIDMDALVEQTDLGAVIAQSSGGVATEALDAARSSAVGLDGFVDRWVARVLRRRQPGPVAPPALLDAAAPDGGPGR